MNKQKHIANPYFHEHFKAVLLYDAPKIKKLLQEEVGGKLMIVWEFVRAYQEINPTPELERYIRVADVTWVLNRPDRPDLGHRTIIHEVKTGRCDITEIVQSYLNLHFHTSKIGRPKDSTPDEHAWWIDERAWNTAGTTNTPIYIWGWEEKQILPTDQKTINLISRGAVKFLSLDLLKPILEEKMGEIHK